MTDLTRVTIDDINQEAELLRLQGKTPNRSLIYKRLARSELIFDEIPVGATLLWGAEPVADPLVTETLVNWALAQSQVIASLVLGFLENPDEDEVEVIAQQLSELGVPIYNLPVRKEKPLTQVILSMLEHRPHTIDELYSTARRLQPSNRPEAAVRQIIRRLKKNENILVTGDWVSLINDE